MNISISSRPTQPDPLMDALLAERAAALRDKIEGAARIAHLESINAALLAVCKRIVHGAVECEMFGDEPSQVDGIEWDDILALRAAIAKVEGVSK